MRHPTADRIAAIILGVSRGDTIAATAYAEGVTIVEEALAEAARSQWDGKRSDLHRQRRRLIELRRGVPNDKADPEAQVVRDLLTVYATVLDEVAERQEYRRGLDLTSETRAELDRLRRRAGRVGLRVLDEGSGEFRQPRREERPAARPPRGDAPPRPARPARPAPRSAAPANGAAAPATAPAAEGADGQPRKRRRRRRSRSSSATPAG